MQFWKGKDKENMLIHIMPLMIIIMFFAILLVAALLEINFRKNIYSKMTGNGYFEMIQDRGKYGEYLVYKELKAYERDGGKFLFNCYLPKDDGTTSEIDVILIHSTGVFVVESKNYSGWIFGNEKSRMWTQTLPNGKGRSTKERFYNPIMQNKTHIKWLKNKIGENVPVYSIIAFSERCELKDVTVESEDVRVIKRQIISGTVKYLGNQSLLALSKMDVERVYEILYPYTQTTAYEKQQHIENIQNTFIASGKDIPEMTKDIKVTEQILVKNENDIDSVEKKQNKKICPKCGAEVILRTAKKGEHAGEQFYGCSRFPKCRYHEYIMPLPQTNPPS